MSSRSKCEPLWFDVVPYEVCECIAAHVTHGKIDMNGVNLAKASEQMSLAVQNSVENPVMVHFENLFPLNAPFNVEKAMEEMAEKAIVCKDRKIHLSFLRFDVNVRRVLGICNITKCSVLCDRYNVENMTSWINHVVEKDTIRLVCIKVVYDGYVRNLLKEIAKMDLEQVEVSVFDDNSPNASVLGRRPWNLDHFKACRCFPKQSGMHLINSEITKALDLGPSSYIQTVFYARDHHMM